jgi:tetratricopeptide (TPR) repeat protein
MTRQRPARTVAGPTPATAGDASRWPTEAAGAILIVAAVLLAFWPSLDGGYLWDDDIWIASVATTPTQRLIHDDRGLYGIWFTTQAADYWPLSNSLFWLEWRLWGMIPTGYRAVNLLLHASGSLLVWRVLRRLQIPGAWLGACLFAIHPVTVASVAWIAELKNCLSLPLYAAALLAWLRFDEEGDRRWYAASLAAFALALLAKTSTVALPLVLLLACWWRRGRIDRRDLVRAAPFLLLALAMGLMTIGMQAPRGAVPETAGPEPLLARIAASGCVVLFYLTKALVPVRLAMIYPQWTVDPTTLRAWMPLVILAGTAAAIQQFVPRWRRALFLALGCFSATLAPVLGIIPMRFGHFSPLSDHLQYLAIPAITALVAAGLATLSAGRRTRPVARAVAALLLVLLMLLTWHRSFVFRSDEALWRDSLAKNPYSAQAHYNLAEILAEIGRPDEAAAHYRDALRLEPGFAQAHNNLGALLGRQGHLDDAIAHFAEAVRIEPDYAEAHNNWGVALAVRGDLSEAVAHFEQAVRLNPDHENARLNLRRSQEQVQSRQSAPTKD